MGRKLLTALADRGCGNEPSDTTEMSVKYIHDIFLLAARSHFNVWMLCGSLRAALRDRYTREVTGVTFGQSVREVIDAGQDVCILLWNDPDADQPFSPSLLALLIDLKDRSKQPRGALRIRATGSPDGWDKVTHFVAATNDARQTWLLRVEAPHKPLTGDDLIRDREPRVQAAAMFATDEARKCGKELLDGFWPVFVAAGRRADESTESGIYYPRPVVGT